MGRRSLLGGLGGGGKKTKARSSGASPKQEKEKTKKQMRDRAKQKTENNRSLRKMKKRDVVSLCTIRSNTMIRFFCYHPVTFSVLFWPIKESKRSLAMSIL